LSKSNTRSTSNIEDFYNKHSGETCLIIGNGPGLGDIPISFLESYPSFGSNLIYNLEKFTPTYYATCDSRIMREYQKEVMEAFAGIPKFLPTPNLDKWQGPNIYRFRHRPGSLWPHPKTGPLWPSNLLSDRGITYISVTHVLLQLAYFMGFEKMLCVGLDNTGDGEHFYGADRSRPSAEEWDEGYGILASSFYPREVVNISTRTKVTTLPKDDWRNYIVK
jgi:hypothetical protein